MADETTEKAEKPIDTSVKARYWWAVLYQENMVDGWRDNIEELLQLPYAYCEHVADVDGKGEHRKDHVHVIIVFGNTTTYKTAMSVFKRLGEKALNKCERVIDIRHCYDYLIHDTDKCRKLGKHQYDPSERITGNGFDIGNYEQISTAEKQHMLKELTWFIMSEGYETINEFTQPALERFGEQYWEIMVSYSAFLVKYLNGNKMMREKAEMQKRLAWEEAMRERCRNNEADSHSVDRAVVQPAEDEAARIVAAAREEAAALLNDAEARKAELVTEIADKEGDLAELDSQLEDVKLDIEDEQDRLECLRQRADGVARDVGELRSIAAEVRGWEAAGKAERGAILDRIAAQCDGLASRIRAGVAGIRLKVEELRSRISRPLEYLMRREQPRQQSLNDVLRDAQRAADAWNRDHAAPQRTYRGRAR